MCYTTITTIAYNNQITAKSRNRDAKVYLQLLKLYILEFGKLVSPINVLNYHRECIQKYPEKYVLASYINLLKC